MKKSMDKIQLASSTIRIITWTIVFQTSLTSMVPRHCSLPRDCCAKRCKYSAVRDGSNCIVPCWRARRKRRSMYQSVRRPPDGWLEMCWFCSVTRSSQKQRYRNAWIVLKRQCPFAKHLGMHATWQCGILSSTLRHQSPNSLLYLLWKPNIFPSKKGGMIHDDSSITFATIGWFTNNLCYHWVISTASQVRPVIWRHEFQGTKRSEASNEIHGSPTCFPHPVTEAMKPWIGWFLGCKMIVLHPIYIPLWFDKCRTVVYE